MTCTSVVPCLSSGLAKKNKIMSMFVSFSGFLGHFESLAFEKGETNLTPKQSKRMFSVNFSKIQQLVSVIACFFGQFGINSPS